MSTPTKQKVAKTAKPKNPRPAPAHPKYIEMIRDAIAALKERNGSSRQKIGKYIQANYKVGEGFESHLKLALRRGVTQGTLVHTKGIGAAGSFKLVKKDEAKPKRKVSKTKTAKPKTAAKPKPKADKPKTTKPKSAKAAGEKKTAKPKTKTQAKPKKTTTPKPKAATTKKPAAKKPAAKKPAAKTAKKQ